MTSAVDNSAVRRVYIRNDAIGEDDLFVPTKDLLTVDNLIDEAIERMKRLGAYLDKEGLELQTKDGRRLQRSDIIVDSLSDGQVVIATTANQPRLAPHVRMQHPALKDNIRLWVPLDNVHTLEEVRGLAEHLLQQSDETLKVSQLCTEDGTVLNLSKGWQECIRSGVTLYSQDSAKQERRKRAARRKKRDSALFEQPPGGFRPSITEESADVDDSLSNAMKKDVLLDSEYQAPLDVPGAVTGGEESEGSEGSEEEEGLEGEASGPLASRSGGQIAGVLDTASMQGPEKPTQPQAPKYKSRSFPSALTYISVRRPSINREKLTYFFTSREELVKRLPGGSWAVFGGDRRISIRGIKRDSVSGTPAQGAPGSSS